MWALKGFSAFVVFWPPPLLGADRVVPGSGVRGVGPSWGAGLEPWPSRPPPSKAASGGGCTKASIAYGNLTPYLWYGALSRGDRTQEIFQMNKKKFPCVRSPSGDTVPRAVDQSEASLQTKISCCMWTKVICCGEPWRNHPKRNVVPIFTDEELHALITAVISRK